MEKTWNLKTVGYFLYKKFLTDEKEEFTPPKEAEAGEKEKSEDKPEVWFFSVKNEISLP